MYLHTRSKRTNNSFVAAIIHRVCFFFLFLYNFIHRRYHQLSLPLSSFVNNKGIFFFFVIISVILTLLIDTKIFKNLLVKYYYFNQLVVC